MTQKALMDAFEAFWDSDCPRIGDAGAPTFKQWHLQNSKQTATAPPAPKKLSAPPVDLTASAQTLAAERAASSQRALSLAHLPLPTVVAMQAGSRHVPANGQVSDSQALSMLSQGFATPLEQWVSREEVLSRVHWRPLLDSDSGAGDVHEQDEKKATAGASGPASSSLVAEGEQDADSVERIVLLDDVRDFLFDIADEGLRIELFLGLLSWSVSRAG